MNSRYELVGSRAGQVESVIGQAGAEEGVTLRVTKGADNTIQIDFPRLPQNESYKIWMMSYKDFHTENVPSGENRGRTLSYSHAVRDAYALENWDGTARKMVYPLKNLSEDSDGLAVLAQNEQTGAIVAVGRLKF